MALINKLSAIGEAIREKTGKEDLLTLDEMPQAIKDIESGGGGVDFMSYLTTASFSEDISEITENITLDVSRLNYVSNLFGARELNCEKLTIRISDSCSGFMNFMTANNNCIGMIKEVEIIGNTSNVTNWLGAFNFRKTLEKITGDLDFSGSTNFTNTFNQCISLKEIRIKPNTIKKSISFNGSAYLTLETLQSIIDGLVDMTGADSQVLKLHTNAKAKLTPVQIAIATNKNWTLA